MLGPRNPLGGQYVGAGGALVTPEQVAQQKQIAAALLEQAGDTSPVGHWSAALNRGLQGWLGGRDMYRANQTESQNTASSMDRFNARNSGAGAASRVAEALAGGVAAGQPVSGDESGFLASLVASESGGNWNALNKEGYGGRLQFGATRLADAARAGVIPAAITGAEFSRLSPEQQMAVEQWHFNDIDQQAERMGLGQYIGQTVAGIPITREAIRGMAHLGGIGGAAKFLQSGGRYNPADSNGTSLADYALRHGGAGAGISAGPSPRNVSEIAELLADQWLPESAKAVLRSEHDQQLRMQNAAYEMQLQQQDPLRQIELQQEQLKLEQMLNPDPKMSYVQMPNGEFVQVNESAGTLNSLGNFAKPEAGYTQLSPDEANQLGLDPNRQWQVSPDNKIEPIGGTPLVQNNLGGEREWDKESAKLWAKRYDSMVGGASAARDMLGMYDLAESALNSGVRTGFGASQEQALRRMASGLGLGEDADKLAAGELLNTIQNRMALMMRNPDGGMGMPGAMSDADRNFLRESQIGLDRTPEGNRRMLQAFRAIEQRKVELANLADAYISDNGKMDEGFNKVVQKFADENPLFGGQEKPLTPTRRRYNPQTRSFE